MKPSNNLHTLIHSLSSPEKNYIKKYASVYSKNKHYYSKLLEAIHKQNVYDENALLIKFRKASFVKHFAVTKNQLFELILKLLRQFHHNSSIHATINASIENARLLQERGLAALAFKQLDKAYKLAEEYAAYLKMQEVLDLKRHFVNQLKWQDWRAEIDALLSQKETLLKAELEYTEYARIYYQLLFLVRKYNQLRNEQQQQELKNIIPSPQFKSPEYKNHIYSQLLLFNIKSIYYFLIKEFEQSTSNIKAVVNLWDQYPKVKQKNITDYIEAINNHMNLGVVNTDFSIFEYSFNKIETINQNSVKTQAIVFKHKTLWTINYYQLQKRYDELLALAPQFEQSLKRFKNYIDEARYFAIMHSITLIYFICGAYDKSIERSSIILSQKSPALGKNIYLFINMMVFFAHYSMGNLIFLESALKNYRRRLQKNDSLYEFEGFQLRTLLLLCKAKNRTETLELLDQFEQELTHLLTVKPALKTSLYGYFNLKTWIMATKKNCSMKIIFENGKNTWELLEETDD